MLTISVRDWLNNNWGDRPQTGPEDLYVIRNGEDVFYVGYSSKLGTRLSAHFPMANGQYYPQDDCTSKYWYANLPESLDWQIDMLTAEDAEQVTGRQCGKDAHLAEMHLIGHYGPFLNFLCNQHSKRIPAHYRRPFNETPEGLNVLSALLKQYGKTPSEWAKEK